MTEPSYDKQREKYFDLLQAAEDLLNDGVDPDSIIEYLNEKKGKRAFQSISILWTFFKFSFCKSSLKISTNYRLFDS